MGWDALREHHARVADRRILDLIDEARPEAFSVRAEGLVYDYAKTNLDAEGRGLLLALAGEAGVAERRERMFAGAPINETEGRAVLHTALRNLDGGPVRVGGEDVMPGVRSTLARMERFAAAIRDGDICCPGGGVFTDVVNIGIGGSDLGPAMAVQALAPYADGPRCHFVSNVDPAHIHDVLAGLNPAATLVIVASKTFTTAETMANAHTAREWIAAKVGTDTAGAHFVALSSDLERTAEFGISEDRVFGFADWVGGRYSVWGPIGLSLMLAIGAENFRAFLEGGQAMDRHFREAEGPDNMPLMLGLVGLWHNQVCGHATRAVLPYEQRLARLPAYLQQLEMESNGKRVAMDGSALEAPSGPVVWGEAGTNGQHAFMQLIHQGTRVVPVEFMLGRAGHEADLAAQHRMLQANCLAQGEALLRGRSLEEARAKLADRYEGEELERQARHRVMPGNRPSTTLVYPKLTPFVLGQILALYEHRVFVEGAVLGINSFDQWGVELGKELATALVPVLEGDGPRPETDSATRALADLLQG